MTDSTPATAACEHGPDCLRVACYLEDEPTDARFSTLPTDTLRRLLWAAKGAPCTCISGAGMSTGGNGPATLWVGKKFDCLRCTAIRDVCEAAPDVR